jgi:hypothetical protein
MSLFGSPKRKKSSLAARVRKLETKVAKKARIAALKTKEASLRKKLRGY